MLYEQYQPYHTAFSDPEFTACEEMQEQEWSQMTAGYSRACSRIFRQVQSRCETLDFEGSRIYDETPDMSVLWKLTEEICRELEMDGERPDGAELSVQAGSRDFLEDLVQVLLLQEITRRRCRNVRCRKYESRLSY